MTYRFASGHRIGAILALLFFGAWFGGILWAYVVGYDASMRRVSVGGLVGLEVVPFGMGILCLYWINQVFGRIAVDETGIEIRSFLGTVRREFYEFERLEPMGSNREGFVLWTPEGKSFKVSTQGLEGAKELRDWVKARIVRGIPRPLETTEFRPVVPVALFGLIAAVGVLFIAYPWWAYGTRSDAIPLHVMYDVCALMLIALGAERATTRVNLYPDRLEKRSLFGNRIVRFTDVRQINLEMASTKGGTSEVLRLIGSGRDFLLSGQYSHFTQLRDTVVARCPQAKIQDSRPAEYR